MSDVNWRRAREILSLVLERPAEDRAAMIESICGEDAELADGVAALLAHAETTPTDFLEPPQGQSAARLVALFSAEQFVGRTIDAYHVTDVIATGGMGIVLRAERPIDQARQTVAIKLLYERLADEDAERRFRRERMTLARLNHANITRLLDAGVLEGGQPYLVMDFVDGVRITEYCRQHDLDLAARLALFATVCDAVQHAHQNLVIHCDLKPSNILVAESRRCTVLDFGIAKLLEPGAVAGGDRQTTMPRPLTPRYASPEQRQGQPLTTASDIYSLGVLLAEMIGQRRSRTDDLQTIIDKARHNDPDQRYTSCALLAEDIERFGKGEPIRARPDSTMYRLRKFVARNRRACAVAVIAVVLFVAGSLGTVSGWYRARLAAEDALRQRDLARQSTARAKEALAVMTNVLSLAGPEWAPAPNYTVRALLDDVARAIDRRPIQHPALEATLRETIGRAYISLARLEDAEQQLTAARRLRERDGSESSIDGAHGTIHLSRLRLGQGRFGASAALAQEALTTLEQLPQTTARDALRVQAIIQFGQAQTRRGAVSAALATTLEGLEIARQIDGGEPMLLGQALEAVAELQMLRGELPQAEARLREALSILTARFGPENVMVASTKNSLALALRRQRRYDEAIELYQESRAALEQGLGPDHPFLASTLNNLGLALIHGKRDYDQAGPLLERALRIRRAALGDDHPEIAESINNLAVYHDHIDDNQRAIELFAEALRRLRVQFGDEHPQIASALANLGSVSLEEQQFEKAAEYFRSALPIDRKFLGADHLHCADDQRQLGHALLRLGRYAESRDHLNEAARIYNLRDPTSPKLRRLHALQAELEGAVGKPMNREN